MIPNKASLLIACCLMSPASVGAAQDPYQPEIPAAMVAKVNQAKALRKNGRSAESIRLLTEVVTARPDYYLATYNLALAYSESGDLKNGTHFFEVAIGLQKTKAPSDWTVYNSAGWAYMLAGQKKRAEELMLIAHQHLDQLGRDSQKKNLNNLGYFYMVKGDFSKSEQFLNKAADMNSDLAKENLSTLKKLKK